MKKAEKTKLGQGLIKATKEMVTIDLDLGVQEQEYLKRVAKRCDITISKLVEIIIVSHLESTK